MNTLTRWGRFSLVGALGMGVQLSSLALFHHWDHGYYLLASAAAMELTLLHNVTWHLHYTWRDRRDSSSPWAQIIRFHLSNGMVSLLGNLALVRLLVRATRLPVLAANLIAIACCSLATFWLGNRWAFASLRNTPKTTQKAAEGFQSCEQN